ncbi:MAG: SLC13 family permease [Christensenellales bacterium]
MIAPAIFLATYASLLAFPHLRAYIALGAGALFIALGILPLDKVIGSVDWNVLLMIAGTMGTVHLFIKSKMPSLMADHIIDLMPNVKWIIIALALFAGLISAFVDNVATVLMVVPVALVVAKKLNISPVPAVIAIAISSNLQGAATLVGDTTSILLGGAAKMDFLDFFFYKGKPGMFFVVQIGALLSAAMLVFIFRKYKQKVKFEEKTLVTDYFPTILLVGTVLLLILASFIPEKPAMTNGLICVAIMLLGLIREAILSRKPVDTFREMMKEIDFFTLMLLAGLFIVIAGITEAGVVTAISQLFVRLSSGNLLAIYSLIVWASVLFSAFIDNIPYVATMLPVTAGIASLMGVDPTILYFGLLAGATLGGNLTPIGASANITALGILRKNGYEVGAKEFMRISVPFTLTAVLSGYIMIWLFWGPGF